MAILGRQPSLGAAELEAVFGSELTAWFSDQAALVDSDNFLIGRFGGIQKAGRVVAELPNGDWHQASQRIINFYVNKWAGAEVKITFGISAYGFDAPSRDIQKTGIAVKQRLKRRGVSLRLLPNPTAALNTAASHHNKLGLSPNKTELLVARSRGGRIVIAESIGAQNISAYAARDQERPRRDAFTGMLPPKLAQIMINLALTQPVRRPASLFSSGLAGPDLQETAQENARIVGSDSTIEAPLRILDPFCGTGVILQEAALLGYSVYGTDISEKMIRYSRDNLNWLQQTHRIRVDWHLEMADAIEARWQTPVDAVVAETYLGQPFNAPPSPEKLQQVVGICELIISRFLQNLGPQIKPGTPLCLAVPAWRDAAGRLTRLPLTGKLSQLGYSQHDFKNVKPADLIYFREDQIVARELLILSKT